MLTFLGPWPNPYFVGVDFQISACEDYSLNSVTTDFILNFNIILCVLIFQKKT